MITKLFVFSKARIISVILSFVSHIVSAGSLHLYIDAQGYNQHEAKISASLDGMRRAVMLIADQLSLTGFDSAVIPYSALKPLFQVEVKQENFLKGRYQAEVIFTYDQRLINNCLLKYSDPKLASKFYDYLVIPISRQRDRVTIWQPGVKWLDLWKQFTSTLEQHGLLYPADSLIPLSNIITEYPASLDTYHDLFNHLSTKLFKKILFIYCEEINVKASAKRYLKVDYVIFSDNNRKEKTQIFHTLPANDSLEQAMQAVIKACIKDYGRTGKANYKVNYRELNFQVPAYSSKAEVNNLVKKLSAMPALEVTKVLLKDNRADIMVHTKIKDEELAEIFYNHNLTYKIQQDGSYLLIELNHGL